jgi:histidyl-tRNA synthetase
VPSFQTTPGTRDILPPDAARWRAFVESFDSVVSLAGFQHIVVPMFEDLGVFQRLGDATDVVTKEMYDFVDKGGRHVALRPEQTAGVCRSYAQHRPTSPWKVWYGGPNFRYERAQHGRYRQFDQVGVEALGSDDPLLDVEVIALAVEFFHGLGLRNVVLHINSLGDSGDRSRYVDALAQYFESHIEQLSPESVATLQRNPLRVLDSKRENEQAVVSQAPSISGYLSDEAASHFAQVKQGLDALGISYVVNERLVRGLDYYCRTTFEFQSTALESAQTAVGGGGRYDGLVEDLGGPATPGIGFAIGLDRTLLACDAENVFPTTGGMQALQLCQQFRNAGLTSERTYGARAMKAQMKAADKAGASFAVIIGTDELSQGVATVKSMVDGNQEEIPLESVVQHVAAQLGKVNS